MSVNEPAPRLDGMYGYIVSRSTRSLHSKDFNPDAFQKTSYAQEEPKKHRGEIIVRDFSLRV